MVYIVPCLLLVLLNAKFAGAESLSDRRDLQQYRGRQCWKNTYSRGVGRPLNSCPDDRVKHQSLCYKPCKDGYKGIGPVCWKGWRSHRRGSGKPMGCGGSRPDQDAGLCYPDCEPGYVGVGPICWVECPDDFPHNGGAMCCKTDADCASKIIGQIGAFIPVNPTEDVNGAAEAKNALGAANSLVMPTCDKVSSFLNAEESKVGLSFPNWWHDSDSGSSSDSEDLWSSQHAEESVLESENERLRASNKALRHALEQMQHE